VSKDEDFHQLALLRGPPPKVVWVRLGNCTTDDIERVIREGVDEIATFAADEEAAFLVLGP
jgi:predicted nuclease of predicted toxin-antitoxin system